MELEQFKCEVCPYKSQEINQGEQNKMTVGEILRYKRQEKHVTIEGLHNQSGIAAQTILNCELERTQPTWDRAIELFVTLGCSVQIDGIDVILK